MINHPKRVIGALPKLKSKRFGKRYIFFDTESYIKEDSNGDKHLPLRLGVAIYIELDVNADIKKREVYRFKTTDEFYEFVLSKSYKGTLLRIYAHNIKHDIMVLDFMLYLAKRGLDIPYPVINGLAYIQSIKTEKGKILLLDSANFVPFSLKKLGADLGIQKGEPDFENINDEELYQYCENDVHIIEVFITGLIKFTVSRGLGAFKNTLAAQAMTFYRTFFMSSRPFIHSDEGVLALERAAYFGGRTVAFEIGKLKPDDYYYLDVNSLYPYHMMDMNLPTQILTRNYRPTMFALEHLIKNRYMIAEVTLNTKHDAYPMRHNGKLIFPVGRPRVVLHHDELLFALENGDIEDVHKYVAYHTDELFYDYVMYFYALKNEAKKHGNKLNYQLAKLFLNSLYGKFGQRYKIIEVVGQCNIYDNETMEIHNIEKDERYTQTKFYGKVYVNRIEGEAFISSPVLAGAITAKGRMQMYRLILKAGKENVFYTDTDSLIVNSQGLDNLKQFIDSTRLGYLDIEATAKNVTIYGAKDYIFGRKVAHKGVPVNAEQLDEHTWMIERFLGYKTWIRYGATGTPYIRRMKFRRKTPYSKGVVLSNGRVDPFIFDGFNRVDINRPSYDVFELEKVSL